MLLTLSEIILLASLVIYLVTWEVGVRRRKAQAWERLVEQLQPNWISAELCSQSVTNHMEVALEERWRSIQDAHGLWAMYENARIMLEMANQAAAKGSAVDQDVIDGLRSDAMQIRVCVLVELSRCAYTQANDAASRNVARAAEVYADMVGRMAELLQTNSGVLVPSQVRSF